MTYSLNDLVDQCDPEAEENKELQEWQEMSDVGNEAIGYCNCCGAPKYFDRDHEHDETCVFKNN